MKLIVGLGNPGKNYENTRHNCGFKAINFFAEKNNLTFKKKFNGEYCETIINNEKIILLKPQTYMNLSGNCVIKYVNYFDIKLEDILIIYDDVSFDTGTVKIKRNGSSGGHNGIANIIKCLKSEEISRIKIGISKNENISLMDYVLGKFDKEDSNKINLAIEKTYNIINDFSSYNIDKLMEKYNGKSNE